MSGRSESACLFLVFQGKDPLAPSARVALDGVDEVTLGRGEHGITPVTDGSTRRIDVRIADDAMSRKHARLRLRLGEWVLEDCSKNGSFVNGRRKKEVRLADGDWIQVGHAFLRFRVLALQPDEPSILDQETLNAAHPRLATLLPSLSRQFDDLARVAPEEQVVILLLGETGTGKDVVTRAIHELSARRGLFVPVNCGELSREHAASALFGHKRGAHAMAVRDWDGLVQHADGGTLLLDEIGDLPYEAQVVLLRVLEAGEVRALGATRPQAVDVRFVAATNRPLDQMASDGRFRGDLLYRLNEHRMVLPPLRDRKEDLGLLVQALLGSVISVECIRFDAKAVRALLWHDWPGNIRELKSALDTAIIKAGSREIHVHHLPQKVQEAHGSEHARLVALLRKHHGNIAAVALEMGKARNQIHRMLKKYEIDPNDYRN